MWRFFELKNILFSHCIFLEGWPDSQRVAWIVPYLSAPYLPKYAAFCFRTIATASPFLHFFLFYENASMILSEYVMYNNEYFPFAWLPLFWEFKQRISILSMSNKEPSSNVCSRNWKGFPSINLSVLSLQLKHNFLLKGFGDNVTNTVQQNLKEMLEDHPRQLTVYRPLYASAFEDYISMFPNFYRIQWYLHLFFRQLFSLGMGRHWYFTGGYCSSCEWKRFTYIWHHIIYKRCWSYLSSRTTYNPC